MQIKYFSYSTNLDEIKMIFENQMVLSHNEKVLRNIIDDKYIFSDIKSNCVKMEIGRGSDYNFNLIFSSGLLFLQNYFFINDRGDYVKIYKSDEVRDLIEDNYKDEKYNVYFMNNIKLDTLIGYSYDGSSNNDEAVEILERNGVRRIFDDDKCISFVIPNDLGDEKIDYNFKQFEQFIKIISSGYWKQENEHVVFINPNDDIKEIRKIIRDSSKELSKINKKIFSDLYLNGNEKLIKKNQIEDIKYKIIK